MARGKKQDAIGELKDALYSREHAPEVDSNARTPLSAGDGVRPPVAWQQGASIDAMVEPGPQQKTMTKKHMSFGAKFFITSFIFFLGACITAGYLFFFGGNVVSPDHIDIQVVSSSVIDGGQEATFQIIVTNRNQTPLQLADLSIDYPEGTRDSKDKTKALTYERQSLGTIAPGQQVKRTVQAAFYGQEGAQQKLAVALQYSVPGSNSIFKKTAESLFTLGSSPVSISVKAPQEAIAGELFGMEVTVTSNSTSPIESVVLQGQYPFGFSVKDTNPKADTGGTMWRIGTLKPGESKTVKLSGLIEGQDGDERVFRFSTGSVADETETQIKVPFIVVPQTLTVHRPFVSVSISLNGQSGGAQKTVSIPGEQTVTGVVSWQNNLDVPVSNLELRLSLSGPMIDRESITAARGFYESQTSTIVWSKDQDPVLADIAPGASGTAQFSFTTLSPGSGGTVYTNPTVNLNVGVSGVRQGQTGVPESVSSAAVLQASIASAVTVAATALHFQGPFTNSGPMPPKAESKTTYTVQWQVKNASNAIANALVQATLPPYVVFVAAQKDSGVTYDAGSRTVSWSLGDVRAGAGYSLPSRTALFQVAITPSMTQVGSSPALTSGARFSGQDRFAQVRVEATAPAPTISLQEGAPYTPAMANVAPKQ